jgi:hypothetical protein
LTVRRPPARGSSKYTFETLVIGSSDRFAHAAAVAVAEAHRYHDEGVFLVDASGCRSSPRCFYPLQCGSILLRSAPICFYRLRCRSIVAPFCSILLRSAPICFYRLCCRSIVAPLSLHCRSILLRSAPVCFLPHPHVSAGPSASAASTALVVSVVLAVSAALAASAALAVSVASTVL